MFYNQTLKNQFQTPSPEYLNPSAEHKEATFILLLCMSGQQCYEAHQHCNGHWDCLDGTDELFCEKDMDKDKRPSDFIVYRRNRNNYFYSASGDNFGWIDTFTSYNPDNYIGIKVPQRPVNWRFNALGVCQDSGFSVMEQFVYVSLEKMSFGVKD